jgi:GNAT superfamily N-acetyltransferase
MIGETTRACRAAQEVTMALAWIHEAAPCWDASKAAVIGCAPPGVFELSACRDGDLLPGDWWRVEDEGRIAGYGWLDCNWGDGEVLLAVASDHQRQGVGTFIIERLQEEARARGLNYLYNVVPEAHPDPATLAEWLRRRGFERRGDGRLMRRVTGRTRP